LPAVSSWFRRYGFADVYDGLILGAIPLDAEDVRTLHWIGVTRIVNLVGDREYVNGARETVTTAIRDAGIREHRIPIVDYGSLSDEALEEATAVTNSWLDEGSIVYLHCRAGWQRSATVAAGVVAIREQVDVDAALRIVRRGRPVAIPLPHQRKDLRRWWFERTAGDAGDSDTPPPALPEIQSS
jgi:atypical dual specificity phosphatase